MIIEAKRLRRMARYARGAVLDVGFNAHPNPFLNGAVGYDREVRKKPSNYREVVRGDAHELARHFPPKSFDTVLAGETIEHLENPSEFLRQCRTVLKDDGLIVVSTPNPYNFWTFLGNALLIKPGYADHLSMWPFRNFVELLLHVDLELERVVSGSGIQLIPFAPFSRHLYLPSPRGLARHLIYVVRKP